MPLIPWRFQCDLTIDETGAAPKVTDPNPFVTVFVAEVYTRDSTGKKVLNKETSLPIQVKAANLEEFLVASTLDIDLQKYPREKLPTPSVVEQPAEEEEHFDSPPKRGKR
jgi:hypothetical protein